MTKRTGAGRYVRIEGPDGAGKSTQIELAKAYAEQNNIKFLHVREPGGSELGNELRDIILHKKQYDLSPSTEYALFTADRSHLAETVILPALNEGYVVVGDRGIESSYAYQAAAGGLDRKAIFTTGELLLPEWYMQPDALAILSLSKEERQRRMDAKKISLGLDKIESRQADFFNKVHDGYIELKDLPYAVVVDAELSEEALFDTVRPIIFGKEHA
ncbi:MAG: dTMP kinase [Candidatus Microsaccharimonas sp.]